MWHLAVGLEAVPVHGDEFRLRVQTGQSQVHSLDRSIQDVDPVYLLGFDPGDPIAQRIVQDFFPQGVTRFLAQFLGVVQSLVPVIRRENDRHREDRPGQASSARLVASGLYPEIGKPCCQHIDPA